MSGRTLAPEEKMGWLEKIGLGLALLVAVVIGIVILLIFLATPSSWRNLDDETYTN